MRDPKPPAPRGQAAHVAVQVTTTDDVALVRVAGLVDERFPGFPDVAAGKTVVIDVSAMTRMTSFGVRQWLRGMEVLRKSVSELYLLGCPTFFVDQLNMVLNFGGVGQILTVIAPYTCPSCEVETGETIDVLAERATLLNGVVPDKECARCGGKLELDESPESYFAFVTKYAASSLRASTAKVLAANGLYHAVETPMEKPPRITKLVHGSVTYFRIIGTIGSTFRARPFLVGAEGEVVIDLAEVEHVDPHGLPEWRRLLKSLSSHVPAVTLVDVSDSFLAVAGDALATARNISVASVLVPYVCLECGRQSPTSHRLEGAGWPLTFVEQICSICGGTTRSDLPAHVLSPLQNANTRTPPASAKLIAQREEVMSRALTDANVAQAGEGATASVTADDTILGKYKIIRRLSAGGMAEVFLANQIGIGGFEKPVALKRIQHKLLKTRHLAIDMFLNEAKIAGHLMHPNIVQVLDVGEVGGALYLAMEYVRGKDLREVVKKLRAEGTRIPLGEACFVVREVAQALHHAYWSTDMAGKQLSVVHRDVSPHNIILGYDGTVKLLDFGVAMSAVTEQAEAMIVGKWLYMSPEHTMHEQIDHRSDLFSLGVILYLLCTGAMPFSGSDPKAILRKIRAGSYQPLQERVPELPDSLAELVRRLLSPTPEDRPQTGLEVASSLNEIARTEGIESSANGIASLLSDLFGGSSRGSEESVIHDLVRVSSQGDAESVATKKLALGSGPTQAQKDPFDDSSRASGLSPGTWSPGSLPPGSQSFSLRPVEGRVTPTGLLAVDASVSIARRTSEDSGSLPPIPIPIPIPAPAPAPAPPATAPKPPARPVLVLLLVFVAVLGLSAAAMYLIARGA